MPSIRTRCCWRKPISGPPTYRSISATAMNFTWRFIFRSCREFSWPCSLEDRKPIIEILEQTPPIPDTSQWCIFLRNHDELTLEMVTDVERDYMYDEYAKDKSMRINLGIRRRLAPMMDNDRRRIQLLNVLLMSMPGTPIVYYGDEIGMGDNIYLGDRNGVRTPMQWNGGWNAGFSGADPERLYSPLISNPVYGYQAINVESQKRVPHSLLSWMKRLIAVRKSTRFSAAGRSNSSDQRITGSSRMFVSLTVKRFWWSTIFRVRRKRSNWTCASTRATFRSRCRAAILFPRIGDLPYLLTTGPLRILLVPPAPSLRMRRR